MCRQHPRPPCLPGPVSGPPVCPFSTETTGFQNWACLLSCPYLCAPISLPHLAHMPLSALTSSFRGHSSVKSPHLPSAGSAALWVHSCGWEGQWGGPWTLFSPPGYPDLSTSGSIVGSHADKGAKGLTLAPGSPGFACSLPHSSAGEDSGQMTTLFGVSAFSSLLRACRRPCR